MVSMWTRFRYFTCKAHYAYTIGFKKYTRGQITEAEVHAYFWENFHGSLTFLHRNKGEEMAPTITGRGARLLVRKLPIADPMNVYIGDVVVLKNPKKPHNYLVRRLAAIEGYEMASTDEKDESFVLEKDQCG